MSQKKSYQKQYPSNIGIYPTEELDESTLNHFFIFFLT